MLTLTKLWSGSEPGPHPGLPCQPAESNFCNNPLSQFERLSTLDIFSPLTTDQIPHPPSPHTLDISSCGLPSARILLSGFSQIPLPLRSLSNFPHTNLPTYSSTTNQHIKQFLFNVELSPLSPLLGFPSGSDGRLCLQYRRPGFDPWVGKIPWRREWQPSPVFLGFPGGSADKESTCSAGDLGSEDPLENGMAAHSSILGINNSCLIQNSAHSLLSWDSLGAQLIKNPPAVQETWV